jgi:hypothetical protein
MTKAPFAGGETVDTAGRKVLSYPMRLLKASKWWVTLGVLTVAGCGGDPLIQAMSTGTGGNGGGTGGATTTTTTMSGTGGTGGMKEPWPQGIGSADEEHSTAIARDDKDNVIVTGSFTGTLSFDIGGKEQKLESAGGSDILIVKLDALGNALWSRRIGDEGTSQEGSDVAVDSSGAVLVTGTFDGTIDFAAPADKSPLVNDGYSDIFLAKLDAQGTHVWSKSFHTASHQYGVSVATDAAGDVVLLAYGAGEVDFGNGPVPNPNGPGNDIFVARLTGDKGDCVWSKRFGASGFDRAFALALDPADGGIVFTGESTNGIDFAKDGTQKPGAFVAKLDSKGEHVWHKVFDATVEGDESAPRRNDVGVDATGDVLVAGSFMGTVDFGDIDPLDPKPSMPLTSIGIRDMFLAKLGSAGNHVSSRSAGAEKAAVSIVGLGTYVDNSNVIVTVVGSIDGMVDFGNKALPGLGGADALLLQLDKDGNLAAHQQYGGEGAQAISALAVAPTGAVFVTGAFEKTIAFGKSSLTSAGGSDIFVAKVPVVP